MAQKFASLENIHFLLHDVFNVESLTSFPYFSEHSRETFDLVLQTAKRMSGDLLHPCLSEMDKNQPEYRNSEVSVHPVVRTFMKECGEGGWISANAPFDLGGQQLPFSITTSCYFLFASANYSASVYPLLTTGAAHLIQSFGSDFLKDTFIPRMFSGEWQGTMALTEPQAGSSLADITTKAVPMTPDIYKIKGQKVFISAGEHNGADNIVHLLLARIENAPAGTKGISLFVVPRERIDESGALVGNDVFCSGVYHKLGYKGAPITHLMFGDNDDCVGYLVGAPNKGLSYMFQMMNEARLEVGTGAAAIASAAYYASLEYADQRIQGRHVSSKDSSGEPVKIIKHPDIKRMLLFQKSVVEGSLSLILQCSLYNDMKHSESSEDRKKAAMLLDLLTPVAKTFPSEMGVLSVSAGLQILGGYGYCDEFPLEQFYRDARIHPIHEGTTGIQALDLLGRKALQENGAALRLFFEEVGKVVKIASELDVLKPYSQKMQTILDKLQSVTMKLASIAMSGKISKFLADATLYLELFGITAIAWQWLVQGVAALKALERNPDRTQEAFYSSKIHTMKYFFHYETNKINGLYERLMEDTDLTVDVPDNFFI